MTLKGNAIQRKQSEALFNRAMEVLAEGCSCVSRGPMYYEVLPS